MVCYKAPRPYTALSEDFSINKMQMPTSPSLLKLPSSPCLHTHPSHSNLYTPTAFHADSYFCVLNKASTRIVRKTHYNGGTSVLIHPHFLMQHLQFTFTCTQSSHPHRPRYTLHPDLLYPHIYYHHYQCALFDTDPLVRSKQSLLDHSITNSWQGLGCCRRPLNSRYQYSRLRHFHHYRCILYANVPTTETHF